MKKLHTAVKTVTTTLKALQSWLDKPSNAIEFKNREATIAACNAGMEDARRHICVAESTHSEARLMQNLFKDGRMTKVLRRSECDDQLAQDEQRKTLYKELYVPIHETIGTQALEFVRT